MRKWRIAAMVIAGLMAGPALAQTTAPGVSGDDRPPGAAPASGAAVARIDARMTQLEQDLRSVTGRVEGLSHQVRQLNDRLERLTSDLEMQFNELKAGGSGQSGNGQAGSGQTGNGQASGVAPSSSGGGPTVLSRGGELEQARPTTPPPPSQPPAPPAQVATPSSPDRPGLPAGSSKEQYAYAFSLMQKASYVEATGAFSEFLQRHPDDPLADNARYWLGESYYARTDYARAAETFLDAYEKNKTGPKAPDTLLKLGMSLGKLDKKKEACASFRELNRAFPNAAAQIKEKAAQESQRLGCS